MNNKSQRLQINNLYNQDIAPQDSQKTLFYYHKVLALECITALLSALSISLSLINYFWPKNLLSIQGIKDLILLITCLILFTRLLQILSRLKWMKQKKDIQQSQFSEYIIILIDIFILILHPNRVLSGQINVTTYINTSATLQVDDLMTVCIMIRFVYILKFLIHSELYYGSRPDRLSRLYTVKFGTFNSIKFLINQKPMLILIVFSLINYTFFPIAILLIEGKINSSLDHFLACLHYVMVTQATVGYGNIVVISVFGRIMCIICIILGVLNSALVLILFMRAMEQKSEEEQSHFLLKNLQKRMILTKARVERIQNEWVYAKSHCTQEQMEQKNEKLKKFRFYNRRKIMLQREEPINLKRMMISNFSAVIEQLSAVKQKQEILSKYIAVIQKAKNQKQLPDATIRSKRQNKLRHEMVGRIVAH